MFAAKIRHRRDERMRARRQWRWHLDEMLVKINGALWITRAPSLQKFAAVYASIQNHFNQERALYSRSNFKLTRALATLEDSYKPPTASEVIARNRT